MDSPPAANLRSSTKPSKTRRALAEERNTAAAMPSSTTTTTFPISASSTMRNSPFLPTALERIVLAVFPALLLFGTVFSLLSPQVRRAEYDPVTQAHSQHPDEAPGYFARKDNLVNQFFVKRGWFWTTVAFAAFVATHPTFRGPLRYAGACTRWVLVTGAWFIFTQWCFGPPIIDRSFRWTGGRCEIVIAEVEADADDADLGDFVSAVACKAAGGAWKGGHDISGHVFMLVLSSGFLLQEVGWAYWRHRGRREERSIVMGDGAVKGAAVEAEDNTERKDLQEDSLGVGAKFALAVTGLNCWMLLMTAIYFHTWFEKVTGLVTAVMALYTIYIVPRFVPAIRQLVRLPGV